MMRMPRARNDDGGGGEQQQSKQLLQQCCRLLREAIGELLDDDEGGERATPRQCEPARSHPPTYSEANVENGTRGPLP